VTGTNQCIINVFPAPNPKQAVIVSVIDNLTKGASGQAVQNMNIRFGFEEILGLPKTAMFP
jgi:N-acetyl-gamma-glutamyl-phosphate reductase